MPCMRHREHAPARGLQHPASLALLRRLGFRNFGVQVERDVVTEARLASHHTLKEPGGDDNGERAGRLGTTTCVLVCSSKRDS
jgi:hypothetical protein